MKTLGLKNINLLTQEQYSGITEPAEDELWAVEFDKETVVGWGTPDYKAGITIGTSYTAPCAGIVVAFAATGQSQNCNITVNGISITRFLTGHGYAEGAYTSSWAIVAAGDSITITAGSTKTFYPFKGVN